MSSSPKLKPSGIMVEAEDEDPQSKLEREVDELFKRFDEKYFRIMEKVIEDIYGEKPREL